MPKLVWAGIEESVCWSVGRSVIPSVTFSSALLLRIFNYQFPWNFKEDSLQAKVCISYFSLITWQGAFWRYPSPLVNSDSSSFIHFCQFYLLSATLKKSKILNHVHSYCTSINLQNSQSL